MINLPIAQRLTLGFLVAALLATIIAGLVGFQRSQSLGHQSDFYQNLLQSNTLLTTNSDFLQLLNTQTVTTIADANTANPSQETLHSDQDAITNLIGRYDNALKQYVTGDLLTRHPEQVTLLSEAGQSSLVQRQQTLAGSALRTWQIYQFSLQQIQQKIQNGQITQAQTLQHVQGEPTNADAQSALRALIQFDGHLASTVQQAAGVEEQNQIVLTIIGAIITFLGILFVGWLISGTIVQRLVKLSRVTQAVETGHLNRRVDVKGRDEIAEVSASVNDMLETIVGLLDETRNQKDAMTNAAEHLFSDMKIVSAGDLSVNATVSDDSIGMLANAFNFTIGRFRRFVLRTQTTVEQVDVISRQEIERTEAFIQSLGSYSKKFSRNPLLLSHPGPGRSITGDLGARQSQEPQDQDIASVGRQIRHVRENLKQVYDEGTLKTIREVMKWSEQSTLAISRLGKSINMQTEIRARGINRDLTQQHLQELRTLDAAVTQVARGLQQTQQQAMQALHNIDAELNQMAQALRSIQSRQQQSSLQQGLPSEQENELLKTSVGYAQETLVLMRQVAKISQELRSSAIAFQLDGSTDSSDYQGRDTFNEMPGSRRYDNPGYFTIHEEGR